MDGGPGTVSHRRNHRGVHVWQTRQTSRQRSSTPLKHGRTPDAAAHGPDGSYGWSDGRSHGANGTDGTHGANGDGTAGNADANDGTARDGRTSHDGRTHGHGRPPDDGWANGTDGWAARNASNDGKLGPTAPFLKTATTGRRLSLLKRVTENIMYRFKCILSVFFVFE